MSATVCGCELRDGSWVESAVNDSDCRYPALLKAAEGVLDLAGDDGDIETAWQRSVAALRAEVARANAAPGREW